MALEVVEVLVDLLLQQLLPLLSRPPVVAQFSLLLEGLVLLLVGQSLHFLLQEFLFDLKPGLGSLDDRLHLHFLQLFRQLAQQFQLIELLLLKSQEYFFLADKVVDH